MPIYLYIHRERTDSSQNRYRNSYELRHVEYELSRNVNHKGQVISDVTGGRIRVVMDGFGNEDLFNWLFDPAKEENGEIVTLDEREKVLEKFTFDKAKAIKYRMHFDANARESLSAVMVIDAGEITTEAELYYKGR